jgi:hypothetical protein
MTSFDENQCEVVTTVLATNPVEVIIPQNAILFVSCIILVIAKV